MKTAALPRRAAWAQVLLIAAASPFFLFPSVKTAWVALLIPAALILRKIFRLPLLERAPVNGSILVLVVQVALTCFVVDSLADALPKIFGFLFSLLLFYGILDLLRTDRLIKAGIAAFMAGGLAFAVLTTLGMFRYNVKSFDLLFDLSKIIPQVNFNLPGASEGFNPNAVGGILILFAPLFFVALARYFGRGGRERGILAGPIFRYGVLFGSLLLLLAVLLTQSRGSWLALILGLALLAGFDRKKWKFVLIFMIIGVLAFSLFMGYGKISQQRDGAKQRIVSRVMLWTSAVEIIGDHPLLGFGMNRVRRHPEVGYELAHVHNHYLHIAAELGIPALVAYLALLIGLGIMSFETWRRTNEGWVKTAIAGLAGGQLAHLFFGFGDSIPLGAKIGIIFWISAALITVLYRRTVGTGREAAGTA